MTEIANRPGQEPEPWQGPSPQWRDILYCENTGCLIRGRRRPAAITLLSIWSGALTLSCDECARSQFNHRPGDYRILPVSAWYDQYQDARASTTAPGIIRCEAVSEPAWQAEPETAGALPAMPLRDPAAPGPRSLPARGSGTAPPADGRHASHPPGQGEQKNRHLAVPTLTALSLACWIGGGAVIAHADQAGAQNYDFNGQPLDVAGVSLILLPFAVLALWVTVVMARMAAAEHRKLLAGLTPEQRTAVRLAEAAALGALAVGLHEHNKKISAMNTASVMGQVPLTQTAAAMKAVTDGQIAAKRAAWIQAQQQVTDPPRSPRPASGPPSGCSRAFPNER